jgi:hypothetical protein
VAFSGKEVAALPIYFFPKLLAFLLSIYCLHVDTSIIMMANNLSCRLLSLKSKEGWVLISHKYSFLLLFRCVQPNCFVVTIKILVSFFFSLSFPKPLVSKLRLFVQIQWVDRLEIEKSSHCWIRPLVGKQTVQWRGKLNFLSWGSMPAWYKPSRQKR